MKVFFGLMRLGESTLELLANVIFLRFDLGGGGGELSRVDDVSGAEIDIFFVKNDGFCKQ